MIQIHRNIDLKKMTTFGLPARCGRFIEFSEPESDLPELDRAGLLDDALVIGGGSNMLFTSDQPSLTVLHPCNNNISYLADDIDGDDIDGYGSVLVKAGAAVVLDDLCRDMAEQGLWGTENLSGIPGQIGGAAVQNVGAYGTEFKDSVVSVTCYSVKEHRFVTLANEECHYGYRDSIFKHLPKDERMIVCHAIIRLTRRPRPVLDYKGLANALEDTRVSINPMSVREAVINLRDSKLPDPAMTGSAGSFFKNPVVSPKELRQIQSLWEKNPASKTNPLNFHTLPDGSAKLSAAWLIDKAGCKGMTSGGAALWDRQPLVLVNLSGHATGTDVLNLELKVIDKVQSMFGLRLTPEVIHI